MKKQLFLSSLIFPLMIFSMGLPTGTEFSWPVPIDNEESEIFDAIEFSKDIEPLSEEFCDHMIATAPMEVQEVINLLINPETRIKELPKTLMFFGATGNGKSDLAHVIAQKMKMPFLIVPAVFLKNEYASSAVRGLEVLGKIATAIKGNVVIDDINFFMRKNKNNLFVPEAKALNELLNIIVAQKLLFIGTYIEVPNMPINLQQKFMGTIYEIPFIKDKKIISQVIHFYLKKNVIESSEVIERLSNDMQGSSNREIEQTVCIALRFAAHRNKKSPVLIYQDFKKAIAQLEQNERLF